MLWIAAKFQPLALITSLEDTGEQIKQLRAETTMRRERQLPQMQDLRQKTQWRQVF